MQPLWFGRAFSMAVGGMRKRNLGRTGLQVGELSLGTWGLSGDGYGEVTEREQEAVIDRALALGIDLFETADVYGEGKMERKLGARLPEGGTTVVTKVGTALEKKPARKRFDVEYLRRAIGASQERLGRKRVDIVLLHNPSIAVVRDGVAAAFLDEQTKSGAIGAWGVSAGNAMIASAALSAELKPMVLEMAYNVFFESDVQGLGSALLETQTGLLARSVLAHGLLAGQWSRDIRFDEGDHRRARWTPDQLRRRLTQLQALNVVSRTNSPSMRAAAINWVLCNERVSSAVLGPKNVIQLDQLMREVRREPPYLELAERGRLAQRLRDLRVY
jgi:aryl-alcohol dehydrogenase-like predicted oxidoreductase